LHNAGKIIVVKRHLTGGFEKKYDHISFLDFLKSRTEPDRIETGRFDLVSIFKKKLVWLFFIVKNQTEPKMTNSICKSRKQIIIIIIIIKAWIIGNCDIGRCKSGWFMWIGVTKYYNIGHIRWELLLCQMDKVMWWRTVVSDNLYEWERSKLRQIWMT